MSVTFYVQFQNVIQADLPPSFLDNVTKYSGFFFWRLPLGVEGLPIANFEISSRKTYLQVFSMRAP